jgi:outer membrane protein TolC
MVMQAPSGDDVSARPRAYRLGLDAALSQAVRANADLRRARIDVRLARQAVRAARAQYDTKLSAGLSYSGLVTVPVPGQFFQTLKSHVVGFDMGATQQLPTGGQVGLTWSTKLTRQETQVSIAPEPINSDAWESTLKLSVSHPLLKGAGVLVGLAPLRQARLRRDAARWALVGRARAVVRDILKAYLAIFEAQEGARIREVALAQAKRDLKRAQLLLETGRIPNSQLISYRVQVAQRERERVVARTLWLTRSLELLQLIGSPRAGSNVLINADVSGLPLPAKVPSASEARRRVLAVSTDLKAAQKQLKVAIISRRVARRNRRPSLDLTGSIGPLGSSDKLGHALENLVKFKGVSWSVGLTFSYLVGNRAARAASQRSRLDVSRQLVTIGDLRRALATSATRLVAMLSQQARLVTTSKAEAQLREQQLKDEQQRFGAGRSSRFTLQQMQDAVLTARFNVIAARVGYLKTRADLAALTGSLLRAAGLRVRNAKILSGRP